MCYHHHLILVQSDLNKVRGKRDRLLSEKDPDEGEVRLLNERINGLQDAVTVYSYINDLEKPRIKDEI